MKKIRDAIKRDGLTNFKAADLAESDLAGMSWAGDGLHIEIMRAQLKDTAHAETVAIYPPNSPPVSKGYVVHDTRIGESVISQLATHPELQSLGLGALLIAALERRIRERGISKAVLGVEKSNHRARKLYERLGYRYFKTEADSWEAMGFDGKAYTHQTEVDWLAKAL